MLEDEIEATSIWEDAGFIAKLDKRQKGFKDGSSSAFTIQEAKHKAKDAIKCKIKK